MPFGPEPLSGQNGLLITGSAAQHVTGKSRKATCPMS
jgi:hypothetical protein